MKALQKYALQLLLITTCNLLWTSVKCLNSEDLLKRGYILTAPSVLDSGTSELVCLTLHELESNGHITVTLSDSNRQSISQTKANIRSGTSQCLVLKVPLTSVHDAILSINGSFDDGYSFNNHKKIAIGHKSDLTVIQTDKPFYTPGQKVHFRVLHVTQKFLPSANFITSIWIESPTHVKEKEWKSPHSDTGLTNLEFQLSDGTQLGSWTIVAEDQKKNQIKRTFGVEKYVVPQFYVLVEPPKEILPNFEEFTWEVCSYYTSGLNLVGKIKVNVSLTSKQILKDPNRPAPSTITKEYEINGCHKMTVKRDDFKVEDNVRRHLDTINFAVDVIERETGAKMSGFQQKEIKAIPLNMYIISKQYFKPGLPYNGKIQIEDIDNDPVKGDKLEFEITAYNKAGQIKHSFSLNSTTDESGIAKFDIPAQDGAIQSIRLKITATNYPMNAYKYFGFPQNNKSPHTIHKSTTEILKSWYSPTSTYIQIERPAKTLKCRQNLEMTVDYTVTDEDEDIYSGRVLYYQLKTRNNVIALRRKTIKWTEDTKPTKNHYSVIIPITIEPLMSPLFDVLVYYIREDGEVVSDSQTFEVDECFTNQVEMKFDHDDFPPSSKVTIELSAATKSLCAINVVDSTTLLRTGFTFDVEKIFSLLVNQLPRSPSPSVDRKCNQNDPILGPYLVNKKLLGSQAAFDSVGIVTLTDLTLESSPCQPLGNNPVKGARQAFDGWKAGSNAPVEEMQGDMPVEPMQSDMPFEIQPAINRYLFSETWLWELVSTRNDGKLTIERKAPQSINQWTAQTICMSPVSGLGMSPQIDVYTTQPVYLTFRTTPSVKFGETVPLIVTAFKDREGCIPIVITLEKSKAYRIVGHSYEVKTCLCGDKPFPHTYHVHPLSNGIVNVTVSVKPDHTTDSKCKTDGGTIPNFYDGLVIPLNVKGAGIPKEISHSKWICTKKDIKNVEYPIKTPADCLHHSARATLAVSGDLVAPTIDGLDKLLTLPTKCGEQTMIHFSPNVFVLQYLKSTGQLTDELKKIALDNMNAGYQNELKYQKSDGSFSGWRRKPGSIWLTAFVIKSFSQAKSMIDIDPKVIHRGIAFIVSHQWNTGCFKRYGRVYHRDMQGGVRTDKTSFALTSFITIALLEAGYDPSNKVISRAFACIEQDTEPDAYRLAMKTYALALAGKTNAAKTLLKTLETRATTQGDMTYWSNGPTSSREHNIETTSYVLLAISSMHIDDPTFAMRIVRWLAYQRNSHGGFKSTQDTIIGIQALERSASRLSIGTTKAVVVVKNNGKDKVINVNDNNRLKVQNMDIEMLSDTVDVEITGEGCVLTQVTISCYGKPLRSPDLDLDVTVSPLPVDRNDYKIDVCTSYSGSHKKTNMAIVEIQMVTGYKADCSHLKKVKDKLKVSKIHDNVNSGQLTIYIDELTEDRLCFDIIVSEVMDTPNRKPAIIKVYDYYEPEIMTSKAYKLDHIKIPVERPPE